MSRPDWGPHGRSFTQATGRARCRAPPWSGASQLRAGSVAVSGAGADPPDRRVLDLSSRIWMDISIWTYTSPAMAGLTGPSLLEAATALVASGHGMPSPGNARAALRESGAVAVKIRFDVTITLTPSSWASWAGIDENQVRRDVIEYITSSMPDLPGICQTDAILRWRENSGLQPGVRSAIRLESAWPTDRDGE